MVDVDVDELVAEAEQDYLVSSWAIAKVLIVRRLEMSVLSLSIVVGGLVAILMGWSTGLLQESLVLYLVYTLSTRLPTLIGAAQGMRLATATHLRAEVPLGQSSRRCDPAHTSPAIEALLEQIRVEVSDSQKQVVRVAGPTGSGKSVALSCLQDERPASDVAIFGADVPLLFPAASEYLALYGRPGLSDEPSIDDTLTEDDGVASLGVSARQGLIVQIALMAPQHIVVLDESLNALDEDEMQSALADLCSSFRDDERKLIFVSHVARCTDLIDVTLEVGAGASIRRDGISWMRGTGWQCFMKAGWNFGCSGAAQTRCAAVENVETRLTVWFGRVSG